MTEIKIHQGQPVMTTGTNLSEAEVVVVLMHGRGASAHDMIGLAQQFPQQGVAYLAPQAADNTWYPYSGFGPIEANEPYVSSAFQVISNTLQQIEKEGIAKEKIVLGGFSQGACLMAEYVARNAEPYGGILIFSGALLGPAESPRDYQGVLKGTAILIGGHAQDPWVKGHQLQQTGQILEELGGAVEMDIDPGQNHTIRYSEIKHAVKIIEGLLSPS